MIRGRLLLQICFFFSPALSLAAGVVPSANESPTPTASPVTREELAAIMKHPTEPHFDLLRPMSGRWVRCRDNGAEPTSGSTQDRYSSSDNTHFAHTVSKASDGACKVISSEERTSYSCSAAANSSLICKVLKKETKVGEGSWSVAKVSDADLAQQSIKLSFIGGTKKPHKKRRRLKLGETSLEEQESDGRTLDLRVESEFGGGAENVHLDFVPTVPHAKKHAVEPES